MRTYVPAQLPVIRITRNELSLSMPSSTDEIVIRDERTPSIVDPMPSPSNHQVFFRQQLQLDPSLGR